MGSCTAKLLNIYERAALPTLAELVRLVVCFRNGWAVGFLVSFCRTKRYSGVSESARRNELGSGTMVVMKKVWMRLGNVAFWVVWPALWVYLRVGHRTRVLMVVGDEFLALKGWLGSDKWILPGGGLHKGEESVAGAIREVHEETGIELAPEQLKFLYSGQKQKGSFSYGYDAYVVVLPQKPNVAMQKREIVAMAWLPLADHGQVLNPDVSDILSFWQKNA